MNPFVMTNTQKHIPTDARPAPAASLTGVSISRPKPAPSAQPHLQSPVSRHLPVVLPTPLNDDEPSGLPAFGRNRAQPVTPGGSKAAACEPEPTTIAPAAVIDLWEHLAADRLRPVLADLDPGLIARQWPNSLLLRVKAVARRPALEVAHMFAPTVGGPTVAIPIDAMTVDWIVALGREVVTTASPVHETDALPTTQGPIDCGVIALPFGPVAHVDHVLCHLYRADKSLLEGEALSDTRMPPRDRTGIKRLFGR